MLRWVRAQCPRFSGTLLFGWLRRPASRLPPRWTYPRPNRRRVRAMIGLTLFGFIHLIAQRKGWFYHVYPLGIGLACWGAWSLASLAMLRSAVCLMVTAATLGWLVPRALIEAGTYPAVR